MSTLARSAARNPLRLAKGVHLSPAPAGVHGALPRGARFELWQSLLDAAADADAPHVQALAGVLATAFEQHGLDVLPLPGVCAAETRLMLARWFPTAEQALGLHWPTLAYASRTEPRYDEIEDLVALLTEPDPQGPLSRDEVRWVAHAVSQASLGQDHLWQDLHLPSRRELTALMNHWFPTLAHRNDRNMKWKKFLYKQLCDRAEISVCRAPSCSVCTDYAQCFGPEDAVAA